MAIITNKVGNVKKLESRHKFRVQCGQPFGGVGR